MANEDLKRYAAGKGVRLWQVAKRFGVTDGWFSKLLHDPLPDEKATMFRRFVDELAGEQRK